MIIDTHAHLVPFKIHEQFKRLGLAAIFDHCPPDQLKEALESLLADMEKAGVNISIAITACNVALIEDHAKSRDKVFVGFLYDSHNAKEGLRTLRRAVDKHPHLIKCVKTMFPYLGQHPLQTEFSPLYRFCEARKLPIQFHMGGDTRMEQLSNPLYFAKLASLFPGLTIVCLHAGGGMVETIPVLMKLWPNIYLEVEALQLHEAEGSRQANVLRFLLDNIDSSRLMFGSDRIFPEEKYFWRVQAAQSAPSGKAEDLCWKTANRVYDLGLNRKTEAAKRETGISRKEKIRHTLTGGRTKK